MSDKYSRAGKHYGLPDVVEWTHTVHAPHDAALAQAFATPDDVPAIMVGPSDGKTLRILLQMVGARKVVEIGTLAGYSAIHLARGMPAGGHIWSVEFSPRHAELARKNLANAGLESNVTVLEGAALAVLPTLEKHGPFDVVFIDADKVNYPAYAVWAIANLRPGGLLLGDNAFLFGELLGDDDRAVAMRTFHELVAKSCDSVCIQSSEGLLVGIKRARSTETMPYPGQSV